MPTPLVDSLHTFVTWMPQMVLHLVPRLTPVSTASGPSTHRIMAVSSEVTAGQKAHWGRSEVPLCSQLLSYWLASAFDCAAQFCVEVNFHVFVPLDSQDSDPWIWAGPGGGEANGQWSGCMVAMAPRLMPCRPGPLPSSLASQSTRKAGGVSSSSKHRTKDTTVCCQIRPGKRAMQDAL